MQDGHTFVDTIKKNDQNTSFRHFILVKNQDYWWWQNAFDYEKQWSWLLGCMWCWKSVKLMIGMCSMQLCHWSLTNIEGHGKILVLSRCSWWWSMRMEYYEGEKIQESFYRFSKMFLDIASCWTWWTSYFEAWHKESGLIFSQGPKPLSLAWEDEENAEKDISFKTSFDLSRNSEERESWWKGRILFMSLALRRWPDFEKTFCEIFIPGIFLTHSHTHIVCICHPT